jgi:hypothetical protein
VGRHRGAPFDGFRCLLREHQRLGRVLRRSRAQAPRRPLRFRRLPGSVGHAERDLVLRQRRRALREPGLRSDRAEPLSLWPRRVAVLLDVDVDGDAEPDPRRRAGPGLSARDLRAARAERSVDAVHAALQRRLRAPLVLGRDARARRLHVPGLHPDPGRRAGARALDRRLPGRFRARLAARGRRRSLGRGRLLLLRQSPVEVRTPVERDVARHAAVRAGLRRRWQLPHRVRVRAERSLPRLRGQRRRAHLVVDGPRRHVDAVRVDGAGAALLLRPTRTRRS